MKVGMANETAAGITSAVETTTTTFDFGVFGLSAESQSPRRASERPNPTATPIPKAAALLIASESSRSGDIPARWPSRAVCPRGNSCAFAHAVVSYAIPATKEESAMKLIPLFEGELEFDEDTEVGFPTYEDDGDWLAYVEGHGVAVGDRLAGKLRWTNHPRRRADGTWLPRFEGVLKTNDGAEILFAFHGYNRGIGDPFGYDHRAAVAALTLATSTPAYRWVNDVLAVIEADVRPSADPERWRFRAFECVNEIASENG